MDTILEVKVSFKYCFFLVCRIGLAFKFGGAGILNSVEPVF